MMKEIIDYKILLCDSTDLNKVQDDVKTEIDGGWQPLGAPFFGGKDNSWLLQTLVKYSEVTL